MDEEINVEDHLDAIIRHTNAVSVERYMIMSFLKLLMVDSGKYEITLDEGDMRDLNEYNLLTKWEEDDEGKKRLIHMRLVFPDQDFEDVMDEEDKPNG
jgi:cell division protein FtsI/penicillin-binding protein 2